MNIRKTFIKLTKRTYPHGTEEEIFHLLPSDLQKDEFGNLYKKIGDSDVMFTSHLDTATSANTKVNHVFEGDIIKTDGKSILGADDKAGVTIMLYMIEKGVPGLYYFFLGEEVGCVGSKKLSNLHKTNPLPYIKKVISFDRRGLDSVITFQSSQRCASDEFGKALSDALNAVEPTFKYNMDPTGVYTDSAQFVDIYPECTNISVGYYSEHTKGEKQDLNHLEKLAEACIKIDWNSLPVKRDPSVTEYSDYYGYGWGSSSKSYSTYDDYHDYQEDRYYTKNKEEKIFFHDVEFNYISSYTISKMDNEVVAVDLSQNRIEKEIGIIGEFLHEIEYDDYISFVWNGVSLVVNNHNGTSAELSRMDLVEYLPQLDLDVLSKQEVDDDDYPFNERGLGTDSIEKEGHFSSEEEDDYGWW